MRERGAPFFHKRRPSWRAPVELLSFGLYFLCAVLLVLSRIGHDVIADARDGIVDLTEPLLEVASVPAIEVRRAIDRAHTYAGLFAELDRLKKENDELKQWEWRTKLLERKVAHLRSLLNAVEEPGLEYTSGRVIADARGPFVRSALINLGRQDGVRIGYAVINGEGLIGRTVDAGAAVARVLLLNDLNSRIPVLVGPAAVRGLALGDNSAELQLDFLPDGATVYAGDEVYTSGSDGVLPRGLRVGVVTGSPGAFRVRPYAELNSLDTVSVLFFDAPALTSADPPVAGGTAAVSPPPTEPAKAAPAAGATLPLATAVQHAGAAEAIPTGEGQAQAER
ncbi:MAG: rod shape-determining protein MreC [Methyloceanibacter sp.]|uniref:rod shape-determining protein MreC n=1 Tax=Methyloceanibacter sp. TaxID=1965321 RepID=UPI003D6D6F65